jgi:tetratricopeptide (TPR) repeat protein
LEALIYRIKTDQHKRKHHKIDESLPICIINSNDASHGQSTTDLSGQYLHSQLLIDCLIKMKPNANDKKELISLCKQQYDGNSPKLQMVKEFEKEYSSNRALWWYTRDSFLYQILNKALLVQNIHLLFLLRFIISDIEQKLGNHKCLTPTRVYRAQLMFKEEIQMLKDSLGEFIAINSFFSTSLDRQQARSFFPSDVISNDVERVFFEIDADPRLDNIKPFSDISSSSAYPEEKEVLFMIGSIFRLVNIDRDKDGILTVRMKLCSFNDNHLKILFQHMQKNPKAGKTNLLDFCDTLKHMGKWDDAEKYYHRLLNELPDNHKDVATCYRGLGSIAKKKGDYDSSLKWHNKSLAIKMRTLKPDDLNIANSYNSIGNVYEKKKDYARALESYEKALAIYEQASGEDHLGIAICLNNMGSSYYGKHEHSKALELYQQALSIQEKHLPANHHSLGESHGNIGSVYKHFGDYNLALAHHNLKLKIYRKCLPSQHPSIASTLRNIGLIYEDKGDFQQALTYFEKAGTIYHRSLPSTHPDVIRIDKDIRRVSSKLK